MGERPPGVPRPDLRLGGAHARAVVRRGYPVRGQQPGAGTTHRGDLQSNLERSARCAGGNVGRAVRAPRPPHPLPEMSVGMRIHTMTLRALSGAALWLLAITPVVVAQTQSGRPDAAPQFQPMRDADRAPE